MECISKRSTRNARISRPAGTGGALGHGSFLGARRSDPTAIALGSRLLR